MSDNILEKILQEAQRRTNGKQRGEWLAIECPYPHKHDNYNHAFINLYSGVVQCFGKHGIISPKELCGLWGIDCEADFLPVTRTFIPDPVREYPYFNIQWVEALQTGKSQAVIDLREWLAKRGINSQTAARFYLGYTGKDEALPKWAWHKLAIPWFVGDTVVAVKLRTLPHEPKKYTSIQHSRFDYFFNAQSDGTDTRIIQESELDAIALSAICEWDSLSIAIPANQLDAKRAALLQGYNLGIVLDRDEAGANTLKTFQKFFPAITPLYPLKGKKDFGEGLPKLPKWIEPFLYKGWSKERYTDLNTHFVWQVPQVVEPEIIEVQKEEALSLEDFRQAYLNKRLFDLASQHDIGAMHWIAAQLEERFKRLDSGEWYNVYTAWRVNCNDVLHAHLQTIPNPDYETYNRIRL